MASATDFTMRTQSTLPINIVSIDGGGVRGIIAARIFREIWNVAGKVPCHEMCQVVGGTSFGGVYAMGLANGHDPDELDALCETKVSEVFYRTWGQTFVTLNGYIDPKYSRDGFNRVMNQYFGDQKLADAKTNVLVTAVQVTAKPTMRVWELTSAGCRRNKVFKDLTMMEAANMTTAAPTYFPGYIYNVNGIPEAFVDGGMAENDPVLRVRDEGVRLFPRAPQTIISIGTGITELGITVADTQDCGKFAAVLRDPNIIDALLQSQTVVVEDEIRIENRRHRTTQEFRFEPVITRDHAAMDDFSTGNLTYLKDTVATFIEDNDSKIRSAGLMLEANYNQREKAKT